MFFGACPKKHIKERSKTTEFPKKGKLKGN
jgi:hypothetical protein